MLRRTLIPLLILAAAPASAHAAPVTFGADLNAQPANNDARASCASGTPTLYPQGIGGTCMWSFLGLGSAPSLVPPVGGTVTAVRVKVGAVTGRMRINVIRFLFQQTGDVAHPSVAGPFLEAYGPEFTPAPNSITTVPVNLPMTVDPTPNPNDLTTIEATDALALEVETPTTPIPLYSAPGSLSYFSYPGPTAAGVPAPSPNGIASATSGYGVLMNADLDTAAAPPVLTPPTTPAPAPVTPTAAVPTVRLGKTTIPVLKNALTLPIACAVIDCTGTVTLLPNGAHAAAVVTYGSAKFSAKAGKTKNVKLKLNARGKKLLKHKKRVTVTAQLRLSGQPATTRKLTLRT